MQEELRKFAVEHAAPQHTSPVSPEAISQEAGPASTSEAALEAPGSESGVVGDAATAAGHRLVSGISLGMQEAAAAAAEAVGAAEVQCIECSCCQMLKVKPRQALFASKARVSSYLELWLVFTEMLDSNCSWEQCLLD